MMRTRFNEEQIVGVLNETKAGAKTADLARRHRVSEATFYNWKSKYGGLEVSEALRLRALENENAKLKRLLADAMLDQAALKRICWQKSSDARPEAGSWGSSPGLPWDERAAGVPGAGGQAATQPQACCRVQGAGSGSSAAEPALEPGLRSRSDRVWATVPRAQRRRHVTREFLRAVPDTSISGRRVVRELAELIAERGKPGMIISDNGAELTSSAVRGRSG